jgi:hypothetical protein
MYQHIKYIRRIRGSSVGIEMGYSLEDGSRFPAVTKIFLFSTASSYGTHVTSYPMSNGFYFTGGKAAGM